MSFIETFPLQHSTIIRLYSERDEIKTDPEYQRMGGIWTKEKKQLLIDSVINNYDIPKIYFHVYSREEKIAKGISYSVIDGRQRLEAIWQFIEGDFVLADDFKHQDDSTIDLRGLSYDDLAKNFPKIKIKFDSFVLPIIGVRTDDVELIEEMFSRLNEAVPLNAAEKRNAIGGRMVQCIRDISNHSFFNNNVKFSNKRYQYREVAARFLLVEESLKVNNKLVDTKKEYLDGMTRKYKNDNDALVTELERCVTQILNVMTNIFTLKDELLQAQGNLIVYYLTTKLAFENNETQKITRRSLLDFREKLKINRAVAEANFESAEFELLEYDRLSQQGTNDVTNIKERVSILAKYLELTKTIL